MDRDLFCFLKFLSEKPSRYSLKPEGDDAESRRNFDRQVKMLIWLNEYGYVDCPDGCIIKDTSASDFKYLVAMSNGLKYPGEKVVSYGSYEAYLEAEKKRGNVASYTDQSININGSITGSALAFHSVGVSQALNPINIDVKDTLREIAYILETDNSLSPSQKSEAVSNLEFLRKQIEKEEPNSKVVSGLLDDLSKITSIAASITKLWTQLGLPIGP